MLVAAERGDFELKSFLARLGASPLVIAAITASELLYGWEQAKDPAVRDRRRRYVEDIFAQIPIAPLGLPEARQHAKLWAELTARGQRIGAHDMLIAATALSLDYSLATLNVREFRRVPRLLLSPVQERA